MPWGKLHKISPEMHAIGTKVSNIRRSIRIFGIPENSDEEDQGCVKIFVQFVQI